MAGKRRRSPKGGHSQHFLRRGALASSLLREIAFADTRCAIEIGAGAGALTAALAHRFERVSAIEIDRGLCARLRQRFAASSRVEVVEADFGEVSLPDSPYAAVGNLPFRGAAEILGRLVSAPRPPHDVVVVLQDRAAERYAGFPLAAESVRSLWLKAEWHVEITRWLAPADFEPAPRAGAAVLWLARRARSLVEPRQREAYRDFVAAVFAHPTLGAGLRGVFTRTQLRTLVRDWGFALGAPPSAVAFEGWLGLHRAWQREVPAARRRRLAGARKRLPRRSSLEE
ncbi:MAG: methyltransferase domain-containing protein [Proteobacteria bacterium]|nr:methyltransferase domain-containing protein [Pseudomonadota bacterium]